MNRLERLYANQEAIRRSAPRPISAALLAEQFEVTRRTIERDVSALRIAGVPLYAERGRNGGQVSLERSGNIVLTLSPSEAAAMLIAFASVGNDMPFGEAGTTAANRIQEHLPASTRVAVESLRSRIRVRHQPPIAKRTRRTLEEALRLGRIVNISYRDANGNQTTRTVEASVSTTARMVGT